jgi:hypothetical protein
MEFNIVAGRSEGAPLAIPAAKQARCLRFKYSSTDVDPRGGGLGNPMLAGIVEPAADAWKCCNFAGVVG